MFKPPYSYIFYIPKCILHYVATTMTAHWTKKLDPYWFIGDILKTNKGIFSHDRRC